MSSVEEWFSWLVRAILGALSAFAVWTGVKIFRMEADIKYLKDQRIDPVIHAARTAEILSEQRHIKTEIEDVKIGMEKILNKIEKIAEKGK